MLKSKKHALGPRCFHIIHPVQEGMKNPSYGERISPWYYSVSMGCAKPKKCLNELKANPEFQKPPERPTVNGSSSPDSQEPSLAPPVEESPWSAEELKIIATFDDCVNRLIKELERRGRESGSLEKSESFPTWRVRELRQKMLGGLAVWAVAEMRRKRERYFRRRVITFLIVFRAIISIRRGIHRETFGMHFIKASLDSPQNYPEHWFTTKSGQSSGKNTNWFATGSTKFLVGHGGKQELICAH